MPAFSMAVEKHQFSQFAFIYSYQGDNFLKGTIPSEIVLLTSLTWLDLGK